VAVEEQAFQDAVVQQLVVAFELVQELQELELGTVVLLFDLVLVQELEELQDVDR
tara:strand:+ start:15 stop:179 length:165 start_codon:yes stop_codon:yes gene_type:complete